MQIIVVGAGKVGGTLVKVLSQEDNNVTVVDTDPDRVRNVSTLYDVMGVVGNGSSYSVLAEAGINEADMMIAVTRSDEVNLLCCVIANQANNCSTIARVRNPVYSAERSFLQRKLGISMLINPEREAAREIVHLLQFPTANEVFRFGGGAATLLRVRVPENSRLAGGKPLKSLGSFAQNVLLCMVERGDEVLIPSGDTVIEEQDVITIIAKPRDANGFFRKAGMKVSQIHNTLIIGGGKVPYYLAKILLKEGLRVKIIEQNRDRCEELADLLPEATIICGNGTDHSLLKEEHFELMDSMLTSTSIDEENIMLSLYAQGKVKHKVITQLSHLDVSNMIKELNLDSIISPKNITAESILRYVRAAANSIGSNVETLYKLKNGRAEALEFTIQSESKICDRRVEELNLKNNTLIAGILRNGKLLIPGGQDMIRTGDSVVIITTNIGYKDIDDILQN
jgi:trk system potassium uptake protein TrkA